MGGGFSGTLVAVQLLRMTPGPIRVAIVERCRAIGPGLAYRTSCPEHFLNVRAHAMGAIDGEPGHFVDWLGGEGAGEAARWGATADPDAFAPRGLYGAYLEALLSRAEARAVSGARLERILATAVAIEPRGARARVQVAERDPLDADHVVLALGNPPPRGVPAASGLGEGSGYIRDPWSDGALEGLDKDAALLILGTNLTMIDLVVQLARSGHRGVVHAASRHGLLPLVHASSPSAVPAAATPTTGPKAGSLRSLLRSVRESADEAARRGADWTEAVDALRPHLPALWRSLAEADRRRFLRHVRPYWDVHRHRAVPANMRDIERLRTAGQLRIHAGHLLGVEKRGSAMWARLRRRGNGSLVDLGIMRIVDATGPRFDYRDSSVPLVDQLIGDGLARPGPLAMGFDASGPGRLLDRSGTESPFLSTLGPTLRGVLWETTAVPEIRAQAARLAEMILARVRARFA